MKPVIRPVVFAILAGAACGVAIYSQNPGIQRTIVHKADVAAAGREAVVARVEIAPGILAGLHTHPGDEISYVVEGEADIIVEGRPNRRVKAGDGFVIPAGLKHDAHNTGNVPFKLVGVYVVDKDKPMASPAK